MFFFGLVRHRALGGQGKTAGNRYIGSVIARDHAVGGDEILLATLQVQVTRGHTLPTFAGVIAGGLANGGRNLCPFAFADAAEILGLAHFPGRLGLAVTGGQGKRHAAQQHQAHALAAFHGRALRPKGSCRPRSAGRHRQKPMPPGSPPRTPGWQCAGTGP